MRRPIALRPAQRRPSRDLSGVRCEELTDRGKPIWQRHVEVPAHAERSYKQPALRIWPSELQSRGSLRPRAGLRRHACSSAAGASSQTPRVDRADRRRGRRRRPRRSSSASSPNAADEQLLELRRAGRRALLLRRPLDAAQRGRLVARLFVPPAARHARRRADGGARERVEDLGDLREVRLVLRVRLAGRGARRTSKSSSPVRISNTMQPSDHTRPRRRTGSRRRSLGRAVLARLDVGLELVELVVGRRRARSANAEPRSTSTTSSGSGGNFYVARAEQHVLGA